MFFPESRAARRFVGRILFRRSFVALVLVARRKCGAEIVVLAAVVLLPLRLPVLREAVGARGGILDEVRLDHRLVILEREANVVSTSRFFPPPRGTASVSVIGSSGSGSSSSDSQARSLDVRIRRRFAGGVVVRRSRREFVSPNERILHAAFILVLVLVLILILVLLATSLPSVGEKVSGLRAVRAARAS